MTTPCYVGIDVAKAQLDVAVQPAGTCWRSSNDAAGITALLAQLEAHRPTLIVLEATGGHETAVGSALVVAGWAVAVVNPRQVRDFARALGQLAKTDAIDARLLAAFAERVRPHPRPVPSEAQAELLALVTRRQQLLHRAHDEVEDVVDEEERDDEPGADRDHRIDNPPAQLVQVIQERHLAAAHLIVGGSLQVVPALDQVVVRHRGRRVLRKRDQAHSGHGAGAGRAVDRFVRRRSRRHRC